MWPELKAFPAVGHEHMEKELMNSFLKVRSESFFSSKIHIQAIRNPAWLD